MLISLTLSPGRSTSASTTVYGLHTEATPLEQWTWLQKELIFPAGVKEATICMQLELQYIYTSHVSIFELNATVAVLGIIISFLFYISS